MKLVILGVGGMGAISLSKIIAQMSIIKGLSIKSSEIHGMAKKGGLVEVQMKIGEGKSGVVLQKTADFVLVLDEAYLEYGEAFLKNKGIGLIALTSEDKRWVVDNLGDVRFASALVLGKFVKQQDLFTRDDAIKVLKGFKTFEKNRIAFERGLV